MPHEIQLFAGSLEALEALRDGSAGRLFKLVAGASLAVLPVTLGFEEEANLGDGIWYGPVQTGLERRLLRRDIETAARASLRGPLAYLETNYFGGRGYQAAALWRQGRLTFGLDMLWEGRAEDAAPDPDERPINRALRGLGVIPAPGSDAFASFGLAAYRSNADIGNDAAEIPPRRRHGTP